MKIAILKLSGKAIDDFMSNEKWISIIHSLKKNYDGLIIVHGAGSIISEWSSNLNYKSEFIDGQRVTCEKTIEVVAAVQSGLLNTKLVSYLSANNFEAFGLTGSDRGLFVADYLDKELGFVGIPKLNGDISWLTKVIGEGVIPIFSSLCRDVDGNLMNVNADIFTKELAKVLKADTVLFLSDIDGVLIEGNEQSLLTEDEVHQGIKNGHITGGMIPKLQSCLELINSCTKKVWIGSELYKMNYNDPNKNLGGTWIVDSK